MKETKADALKIGKKRALRIAGIDKISGMVLVDIIRGGQKSSPSYINAVEQLRLHAPGALKKLQQQGFV